MIGEYLEIYTYEYLLSKALSRISDAYDKRQGAIMWDAVAPHDYQLAEFYQELRQSYKNTFAETASGEYLDLRAQEAGIMRYSATYALKKAEFFDRDGNPISLPIGTRFATVSSSEPINYVVEQQYFQDGVAVAGTYALRCEQAGTVGNNYTGALINITFIMGIAVATMSTLLVPARDIETDEELRVRYFMRLKYKPFGGNVAQYDEEVKALGGVGDVQVYPVWDGGGTVLLSVVDAEYNPISEEFIQTLETTIDPENANGEKGTGLGIAPIGHKVTVTTPTERIVNISATVNLISGYTLGQIELSVKEAIEEYFLSIRKAWGVNDELNNYTSSIYLARVLMAILSVSGVANVTNVALNEYEEDLILTETAALQEIPVLGTITLTE